MKSGALVASTLYGLTAATLPLIDKRQFNPFMLSPLEKPVKVVESPGKVRPNSKHTFALYGPFEIPAGKPADPNGGHSHNDPNKPAVGSVFENLSSILTWNNIQALLKGDIQPMLKSVPGFSMDPAGNTVIRRIEQGMCKDCTILQGKATLTDAEGVPISIASGVYLHHIGMLPASIGVSPSVVKDTCAVAAPKNSTAKTGKTSLFGGKGLSGKGTLGKLGKSAKGGKSGKGTTEPKEAKQSVPVGTNLPNLLFVQGVENFTTWYTDKAGTLNSGYYAGKETWNVIAEVVNYKEEKKNVYVSLDYEYVDGRVEREAFMSFLSVTGCMIPSGDIPLAGFKAKPDTKSTYNGPAVAVTRDGTILSARGHMHDGGAGMRVFHNDKEVCYSKATYGGKESTIKDANGRAWETIADMSECEMNLKIKKGDTLRIDADLDLAAHPARKNIGETMDAEQMGILFVNFVPDQNQP